MFDISTKLGEIRFSQGIVNKIVMKAAEEYGGKVILHNYKGKYMDMMPGLASKINLYDETSGSVDFFQNDEGYTIKAYLVLKFGTSIKMVTEGMIDSIYENAEKILGEKPQLVTIVVTGILSKNIAKRHIEVSR